MANYLNLLIPRIVYYHDMQSMEHLPIDSNMKDFLHIIKDAVTMDGIPVKHAGLPVRGPG